MIGLLFLAVGVALAVAGLVVLFGAWAAVACGVVLIVTGLIVPWEELTYAKSASAPPGS